MSTSLLITALKKAGLAVKEDSPKKLTVGTSVQSTKHGDTYRNAFCIIINEKDFQAVSLTKDIGVLLSPDHQGIVDLLIKHYKNEKIV